MQTNFRRTVPPMEISTKLAEIFTRDFQIIILSSNVKIELVKLYAFTCSKSAVDTPEQSVK